MLCAALVSRGYPAHPHAPSIGIPIDRINKAFIDPIILTNPTTQVATAIRGAIIMAKLSIVPVRRGYWGRKIGKPHTIPVKVTGKCGSVSVRLVPAPRGCGLVAAPVPKKLLNMAGIKDIYTQTTGNSRTLGNFVKAVFAALAKTYGYLTPDLWPATALGKAPYQEHTDFISSSKIEHGARRQVEY